MSDHLRPPPTSSTGRLQPIARPDWPWAARTYSQGSPQSSPYPLGSVLGSNLQSGWDPRVSSVASNSSQSGYSGTSPGRSNSTPKPSRPTMRSSSEGPTRQWTFMVQSSDPQVSTSLIIYHQGFEWDVRDVHKLRDFVEGVESSTNQDDNDTPAELHGNFEILKQSPVLGDNKFKLEIG